MGGDYYLIKSSNLWGEYIYKSGRSEPPWFRLTKLSELRSSDLLSVINRRPINMLIIHSLILLEYSLEAIVLQ